MATEVFLKLATGKTVRVNCEMSDPIGTIKAKIAEQEGVAVAAQRLIFAGKVRELLLRGCPRFAGIAAVAVSVPSTERSALTFRR